MISFIIAQVQSVGVIDYMMRGSIVIIAGLVLWGIKTIYELRKENSKKITNMQLESALMKKDIENSQKFNEHLDAQYIDAFEEIKKGLSTLITDVNQLKIDVARLAK